jgi:hypothetical protein
LLHQCPAPVHRSRCQEEGKPLLSTERNLCFRMLLDCLRLPAEMMKNASVV